MKNTNLLEHLLCFISMDCISEPDFAGENKQEEIIPENIQDGFHGFDMDEVFAN